MKKAERGGRRPPDPEGELALAGRALTVRRVPQQARSRQMVDRLLSAAATAFLETGFGDTTTNRIAELAGVSVGSLYQFFPHKAALLSELHLIWTRRLGAELDVALAQPQRDLTDLVDGVLEVHARLQHESAGLLGFLLTRSQDTEPQFTVRRAVQERLEQMALIRRPGSGAEDNRLMARMVIHISDALYTLGPRGAFDPQVRGQVRLALLSYLGRLEAQPSAQADEA